MPHYSASILLTAAIGLSFANTSLFASVNKAKCRQWAAEDEVPAAQTEDYLRACIADQSAPPEPHLVLRSQLEESDAYSLWYGGD